MKIKLTIAVLTFVAISANAQVETQLLEHRHYHNHDNAYVHSPAHSKFGGVPVGAKAKCRDGEFSFSRHHRGTCSRHRGVSRWIRR